MPGSPPHPFPGEPSPGTSRKLSPEAKGRAPDQAGLDHWAGARLAGTPRRDVVTGFLNSAEYATALVTRFYSDLLKRRPDQPGLQFWTGQLQTRSATAGAANETLDNPPPSRVSQQPRSATAGAEDETLDDSPPSRVGQHPRFATAGAAGEILKDSRRKPGSPSPSAGFPAPAAL